MQNFKDAQARLFNGTRLMSPLIRKPHYPAIVLQHPISPDFSSFAGRGAKSDFPVVPNSCAKRQLWHSLMMEDNIRAHHPVHLAKSRSH
jgi:hypothetical protein